MFLGFPRKYKKMSVYRRRIHTKNNLYFCVTTNWFVRRAKLFLNNSNIFIATKFFFLSSNINLEHCSFSTDTIFWRQHIFCLLFSLLSYVAYNGCAREFFFVNTKLYGFNCAMWLNRASSTVETTTKTSKPMVKFDEICLTFSNRREKCRCFHFRNILAFRLLCTCVEHNV